jgi:hypothetical protein
MGNTLEIITKTDEHSEDKHFAELSPNAFLNDDYIIEMNEVLQKFEKFKRFICH